jgi:hypothetical protein
MDETSPGKNSDGSPVLAGGVFNRSPAQMDRSPLLSLLDQLPEPL